jgi:elongator complex protein 2
MQNTLWPEFEKLYGHGFDIFSLAVSHDGSTMASASKASGQVEDGAIRLWDVRRKGGSWREKQAPLQSHTLTVTTLTFSWNDEWLLSAGRDRMWTLYRRHGDTGAYKVHLQCTKAHARIIWDAAWAFDDRFFVTGSRDKSVKVWSVNATKAMATLSFPFSATSLALLANAYGKNDEDSMYLLAVGLEDGTLALLVCPLASDLTTWAPLAPAKKRHSGAITCMDFRIAKDRDTRRIELATGGADGVVQVISIQ